MDSPTDRPSARERVFSHLTRTRFLHIEDSLERGKLRFFIGSFEKGKGASSTAYAFMDVEDARVVLSDLSWGKPVEFVDFKGGRGSNNFLISRVLKIETKQEKIWIEVQNGPGQELGEGAVKPSGTRTRVAVSIPLTVFEGRKLAHACLAYLQAWDVGKILLAVSNRQ